MRLVYFGLLPCLFLIEAHGERIPAGEIFGVGIDYSFEKSLGIRRPARLEQIPGPRKRATLKRHEPYATAVGHPNLEI